MDHSSVQDMVTAFLYGTIKTFFKISSSFESQVFIFGRTILLKFQPDSFSSVCGKHKKHEKFLKASFFIIIIT